MKYYDEKILETRREEARLRHTTLETGIYVEDNIITFSQISLPNIPIQIFLQDQFIPMPEEVKRGTDRSKKTQEAG